MRALIATLWIGCSSGGGVPDDIRGCSDSDCRQAWALARWPGAPEAVSEAVRALPDPIERVAIITTLSEAHPGQTGALCAALPPSPERERCTQLNSRPHLFAPRPAPPQATVHRTAPGPPSPSRVPPTPWPSAFAEVPPSTAPCDGATQSSCRSQQAASAAGANNPAAAVSACQAIEAPLWRQECLFMSAQQLVAHHGAPVYRQAVDLCALAGDFVGDCMAHLSNTLHPQPRPPTHDWRSAQAIAQSIAQTWAAHDPAFGAILVDHFWAASAWRRYGQRAVVLGVPEDAPVELVPHARTVTAINLLRLEAPGEARTLAALEAELAAVMVLPRPRQVRPEQVQQAVVLEGDRWPSDADVGEGAILARVLPGGARRPGDADPVVDGALALLEAAAYMQPPRADLL